MIKRFIIKGKVVSKSRNDRSMEIKMDGFIDYRDLEKLTYMILTKLVKNEKSKLAVISAVYDFISDQEEAYHI